MTIQIILTSNYWVIKVPERLIIKHLGYCIPGGINSVGISGNNLSLNGLVKIYEQIYEGKD